MNLDDLTSGKASLAYPDWAVEGRGCVVCTKPPERSHVKHVGRKGRKADPHWEHFTVLPMCHEHHAWYHTLTLKEFEDKFNINLWKEVAKFLIRYIHERETE